MNRDFKGVWIPKEIWLSKELKMLEKVILTEISSLDNEDHCIAGNEYFAEFCSCSLSAVTKTIKHLKELGYIEEMSFDGRHRKLKVIKNTRQNSKIYESESQNLLSNNINNKQENNKVLSKDNTTKSDFQFGKQKPKKESLYTKCINLIDAKTTDKEIRTLFISWLNMLLEKYKDRNKTLYINVFKGKLNTIDEYDKKDWKNVIEYNLQRGYEAFYPPKNFNNAYLNESGVRCVPNMTEEDYIRQEEYLREMEEKGVQVRF